MNIILYHRIVAMQLSTLSEFSQTTFLKIKCVRERVAWEGFRSAYVHTEKSPQRDWHLDSPGPAPSIQTPRALKALLCADGALYASAWVLPNQWVLPTHQSLVFYSLSHLHPSLIPSLLPFFFIFFFASFVVVVVPGSEPRARKQHSTTELFPPQHIFSHFVLRQVSD